MAKAFMSRDPRTFELPERLKRFDPAAFNAEGRPDARTFRCACGGVMFDVTSRLAEAMGVLHYRCDSCRARAGRIFKNHPNSTHNFPKVV